MKELKWVQGNIYYHGFYVIGSIELLKIKTHVFLRTFLSLTLHTGSCNKPEDNKVRNKHISHKCSISIPPESMKKPLIWE